MAEDPLSRCFLCLETATEICPYCRLVGGCSKDHLSLHRPDDYCFPFRIESRESVGRFLVATRDISRKEKILQEDPYVYGPSREEGLFCVGCLAPLQSSLCCPACGLPLCSSTCRGLPTHRPECQYLTVSCLSNPTPAIVLPIRYMLKTNLLRAEPVKLSRGKVNIRLEGVCNQLEDCINIVYTNSKSLAEIGLCGSALYSLYSLMNHSCLPNTTVSVKKDKKLEILSRTNIVVGEEITTRYAGLNLGQPRRSELLYQHWRFSCKCSRCLDPTDLGTRTSAIRCLTPDCSGHLLPHTSLLWRCELCESLDSVENVLKVVRRAENKLRNNVGGDCDSASLESILSVLNESLHPNHFLITQVMFVLLNTYSNEIDKQPGTEKNKDVHHKLERIVQLGEKLVWILQLLDPDSVVLGRILRILIPNWMQFYKQELESGDISSTEFQEKKVECFRFVDILLNTSTRSINK